MGNPVYGFVTERIIKSLEAGTIPWRKPWHAGEAAINYVSRKPYRGTNTLLLPLPGEYLTHQQITNLNGTVRKGEKAHMVVFFKSYEKKHKSTDDEKEDETYQAMVLRYYNVFHISQCEGIKSKLVPTTAVMEPIVAADNIMAGYTNGPSVQHGSSRACYTINDTVVLPSPEQFTSVEHYYSTAFHELVHSTGHASRLARWIGTPDHWMFGSESYSKEELIAEIGAAMLCGIAGIIDTTLEESSSYIAGWLRELKNDTTLIVSAAGRAQRAADYILGINKQEKTEAA